MNNKNEKQKKIQLKAFKTAAFAEIDSEMVNSRVPIPSESAVSDAKKFVDDENQK